MKTMGTIKDIGLAFPSRKAVVTLEVTAAPDQIEELKDMDLDVSFSKHREKRSLDANAYFWLLVNAIAQKLHISDTEVHDKLLSENIAYFLKDGVLDWETKGEEPGKYGLLKDGMEYYLCSGASVQIQDPRTGKLLQKDGVPVSRLIYWHIKGSHQMNSKEMSRLIESTVQEAKTLGIETATPAELEEMNKRWGVKYERQSRKGESVEE